MHRYIHADGLAEPSPSYLSFLQGLYDARGSFVDAIGSTAAAMELTLLVVQQRPRSLQALDRIEEDDGFPAGLWVDAHSGTLVVTLDQRPTVVAKFAGNYCLRALALRNERSHAEQDRIHALTVAKAALQAASVDASPRLPASHVIKCCQDLARAPPAIVQLAKGLAM